MATRRMTNDEHMDRIERYLSLWLKGGRQEERRLKRKHETDEKLAILMEKQRELDERLQATEHNENS
ncbi:MAG: hypothetical protein DMF69_22915 [Acidobacteria bacterium]|nr:MAG: hypothetical protein DMF69_22915 [Acidobacteriota bacterium]